MEIVVTITIKIEPIQITFKIRKMLLKFILIIYCITIYSTSILGQNSNFINFPNSWKKSVIYFSPVVPYSTISLVLGTRQINEPIDSIKNLRTEKYEYDEYGDTVSGLYSDNEPWLTLDIDTLQEIDLETNFYKSIKDYGLYFTPRKFNIIDIKGKNKTIINNKDRTYNFKAMPVYIGNFTKTDKSIYIKDNYIEIIQEALNKKGKWKPIELTKIFLCEIGSFYKTLIPNQQIVTSVYKYKGAYKTLLRLKLISDSKTIYSNPFTGSINYSQFNINKIHYIDWLPYKK